MFQNETSQRKKTLKPELIKQNPSRRRRILVFYSVNNLLPEDGGGSVKEDRCVGQKIFIVALRRFQQSGSTFQIETSQRKNLLKPELMKQNPFDEGEVSFVKVRCNLLPEDHGGSVEEDRRVGQRTFPSSLITVRPIYISERDFSELIKQKKIIFLSGSSHNHIRRL